MELSKLAKHINSDEEYQMLQKWVNTHNKLNIMAEQYDPYNRKNELNIHIDESELKRLDKEIQRAINKYSK
jgi:hypothetical protein